MKDIKTYLINESAFNVFTDENLIQYSGNSKCYLHAYTAEFEGGKDNISAIMVEESDLKKITTLNKEDIINVKKLNIGDFLTKELSIKGQIIIRLN